VCGILQNALGSSALVRQFLGEVLGGGGATDVSAFMDQLGAVVSRAQDGSGLAGLAGLVADMAGCVKQERLEVYRTEHELEARALHLADSYEMLAGAV
jgi:hypothetical protein